MGKSVIKSEPGSLGSRDGGGILIVSDGTELRSRGDRQNVGWRASLPAISGLFISRAAR
jgi:hypothetical protein